VIFRRATTADRAAILPLLGGAIDDFAVDPEAHWRWKFEQNPHGPASIWVADDDGRLAGCYVWNPVRLRFRATSFAGAQAVDAVVDPEYRGRGVFTDLVRAALADEDARTFAAVYAFPVEAAYRGQVKLGFRLCWTVTPLHRPLIPRSRRRSFEGLDVRGVSHFDARFDTFAGRRDEPAIHVDRDAAYLQWRYFDHPVRSYEVLACSRGEELCGYCVFRVDRATRPGRALLVDFRVAPGDTAAASALIQKALSAMSGRGGAVAVSWLPREGPESAALERHGFSSRYRGLIRPFRRARPGAQVIAYEHPSGPLGGDEARPWSIAPGDHDSM
jgi:GNAT superfamily N-acetyltransferase